MKISGCIIAKDEEANIQECLESIYDIVDEIIVLDTGSKDRTREIAKSFDKVKLYETTWKNNFSIARNECISYATGDWILSIDADQRITENSKNLFSKLIWNKEKIDIYKFKIIHTNEYHPFKEQIKTFLFRNNINLKYKNKIHEILDSKGILKEKVISDIEIIHDNGSDYNELEEQSKKYIKILENELEDNKLSESDLSYYYKHLGDEYFILKQYSKSKEYYNKSEKTISKLDKKESFSFINFIKKRKSKLLLKTGMLGLITILSCNNKVENVGTLSKANNEMKFKIKANIIPMGSAKLTELGTCGDLLNFTANNDAISSNGCPENTYLDYDAYRFEPVYNQDGTIAIGYNCTYAKLVCRPVNIDPGGGGEDNTCDCNSNNGFSLLNFGIKGTGVCTSQTGLCKNYCEPEEQPKFPRGNLHGIAQGNSDYRILDVYDDRKGPDLTFIVAPLSKTISKEEYKDLKSKNFQGDTPISVSEGDAKFVDPKTPCATGGDCWDSIQRKDSGQGNDNSFTFSHGSEKGEMGSLIYPEIASYDSRIYGDNRLNLFYFAVTLDLRSLWNKFKCDGKTDSEKITLKMTPNANPTTFYIKLDIKNNQWEIKGQKF